MRTTEWSCDRCGTTLRIPQRIVVDDNLAFRDGLDENPPSDWQAFDSDGAITDACSDCLTDAERTDRLLGEVECAAALLPGLDDVPPWSAQPPHN